MRLRLLYFLHHLNASPDLEVHTKISDFLSLAIKPPNFPFFTLVSIEKHHLFQKSVRIYEKGQKRKTTAVLIENENELRERKKNKIICINQIKFGFTTTIYIFLLGNFAYVCFFIAHHLFIIISNIRLFYYVFFVLFFSINILVNCINP